MREDRVGDGGISGPQWLYRLELERQLIGVSVSAVNKHLKNIFESGDPSGKGTIPRMETVRQEGSHLVQRTVDFYNLDAIIVVGYRVNSNSTVITPPPSRSQRSLLKLTSLMRLETLTTQLRAMADLTPADCTAIIDSYGQSRSEVLGYILSFREYLDPLQLEELIVFFFLLVLGYEREGHGRLQPARATILKASKASKEQVKYVLDTDLSDLNRTAELWSQHATDQPLLAYSINDILKKHDMSTEAGIQLFIAVTSLIQIFRETAKQ